MAYSTSLDSTLINRFDADPDRLIDLLGDGLGGVDDGELFIEYRETESFGFDDGRLKKASFDTSQGFGLRAVAGEAVGCAHSPDFTEAAVVRALDAVGAVRAGHSGLLSLPSRGTNQRRYISDNPIQAEGRSQKVAVLEQIDAYARGKDPRVKQVSASLAGSWQHVEIVRPDGLRLTDIRPLVRLNINVVVGDGKQMESGSCGAGGRVVYDEFLSEAKWQWMVDEAIREATVKLEAVDAPAGEMNVVLGPGWPGSCCMRRSAMAWKATSTERKHPPLRGCWANVLQRPASRSSTTGRWITGEVL